MKLDELVAHVPVYRRILPERGFEQEPFYVYCLAGQVLAACGFFLRTYHRLPSGFVLPDIHWMQAYKVKQILARGFSPVMRFVTLDEFTKTFIGSVKLVIYGGPKDEIEHSLKLALHGLRNVYLHQDPKYDDMCRYDSAFLATHRAALEWLYKRLADEDSRQVLLSVIRYRQTADLRYLRLAAYRQYAHPVVRAMDGDVVYDVGGLDGVTAMEYARQVGEKGMVHVFEPDPVSYASMCKVLAPANLRIRPSPLAFYNAICDLRFESFGDPCSRLSDQGSLIVRSDTIDHFVESNPGQRVSMIKMDTEGSELEILQGAQHTLQQFRPKLQISVYHPHATRDDLLAIPRYLDELECGYDFYLGHHGSYGNETVLYAMVPKVSQAGDGMS